MATENTVLAGRVAIVAGATGGIGSVICRRLADCGASVVAASRDGDEAKALAGSLTPGRHGGFSVDITDSDSLRSFTRQIDASYGRADILVNCAGMTRFVPHADLDGLDDDFIDAVFRTNWRGPFATIRSLKYLLEKAAREPVADGSGSSALIVNIASVAATTGMGSNVAYCASKAALNTMTVSLARALAPLIRVISVSPGVVETKFIKGLDDEWLADQRRKTPLGELVSPNDVADAVLAAATLLRASTGCVIPVDGGRSLE